MKEIEIKLVSKDTINPSSPTPQDLVHYQLSLLDQTAYPVYNPLVFFYSSDGHPEFDITTLSSRLKASLSETLARFYPLAGQLRGNVSVDCNDQGCLYLETRVSCRLSDVVDKNPDPHELRKFVPFVLHDMGEFNLGIQFNVFECGGVGVGICLSHKVGDGFSVFLFTKAWSAICRGEVEAPYPRFISTKIFPPNEDSGFKPQVDPYEGNVTKRFVFKFNTINAIKAKYSRQIKLQADDRPLSRVEALTVFIWTRFIASTQLHPCPEKTYVVSNAVNLRSKLKPQPPDHCFGNIYALAVTVLPPNMGGDFLDLIPKMRESASKINKEFVQKHGNGEIYVNSLKKTLDVIHLAFTSLCRFPMYETDFGWGKPKWVGFPAWIFKNLILFTDTESGNGIEAYITFKKEDMAKFEKDEEFRACV